ncbi:molybdate ABC transporter ATP-binding protein ModF [Desulfococcaceae bacterium HSG7]|nr:molybdate ABC transporter ATP-binding protein ModF [Desulfococcaceae bacterium HSG7]
MQSVSTSDKRFITLDNITVRVRNRHILAQTCWEIKTDQNWAILGPNGSGKSSLARVLCGDLPYVQGKIIRHSACAAPKRIGNVSFEIHERLIAREKRQDYSRDFSGKWDSFETARQTILTGSQPTASIDEFTEIDRIADLLEIRYLLDRGIRFLSSGEMRKVIIARALMKTPGLLIFDEPFEGLDARSKKQLKQTIRTLTCQGVRLILITHRFDEITPAVSHVLCLKNCQVFCQGERNDVLTSERMKALYQPKMHFHYNIPEISPKNTDEQMPDTEIFVKMKNVTVAYNGVKVLDNLCWTVRRGQNWAVTGPNGSGKSTLLSLITGDNLQAYANEIYLFGKRRGSGETIWELKKRIGLVSSELQVRYRKQMRGYDVVLSGFFDSVGLYRRANTQQRIRTSQQIEFLGIENIAHKPFDQLSYGEKRMVLLARSLVKAPRLLILDEPCQGLDRTNRQIILELIDHIGANTDTQFLYVTHYEDEIPSSVTHRLRMEKTGEQLPS